MAQSVSVRIYLCPLSKLGGIGPTMSMATQENGTDMTGLVFIGTILTLPLAENFCHLEHERQNL